MRAKPELFLVFQEPKGAKPESYFSPSIFCGEKQLQLVRQAASGEGNLTEVIAIPLLTALAAPEMLEACEEMLRKFEKIQGGYCIPDEKMPFLAKARKAIAKARGEA